MIAYKDHLESTFVSRDSVMVLIKKHCMQPVVA